MNDTSPLLRLGTATGSRLRELSLRHLFIILFATNIAGVLVLGILSVLMSWNEARVNQKHQQRYRSYQLADELRQSSDDLTRMARTYVVTQDPRFEQMYWDILAIRNGETPRPENYNRIYWDLVLKPGQKPRPDGRIESLEHLMREAGFSPEEFARLHAAQANSDALVQTERIAMNAVKGLYDDGKGKFVNRGSPDIPLATRLMHDPQYHVNKARIMEPIDDFFTLLDQRTQAEVDHSLRSGRSLLLAIQVLVVLLIGLSLATGLLLPREIFQRVGGEPILVEQVVRRIADGELTTPSPPDRWSRGGIMGAMRETTQRLRQVVRSVQSVVDLIAQSSESMNVGSDRLAHTAAKQATATTQAAATIQQMAEAIGKTATNARRTEQLTRVATRDARDSGRAVADAVAAMRTIAQKLSAVEGITRRTHMISINAAIEAARAGSAGKEFSVVATEIRGLAEHTQAITVEMNHLIESSVEVAETAGSMLAKLVPDIEQTASLIAEISAHASEQSEGAGQITLTIQQLVQGTQVCSSSSSELSGLAERLADESRQLQGAISFFHLLDEDDWESSPRANGSHAPLAVAASAARSR